MTTTPTTTGVPEDEPERYLRLVPGGLAPEPGTEIGPAVPGSLEPAGDAETHLVGEVIEGVPVDPDDIPLTTTWTDITSRPRVPIIPAWLRDKREFRARVRAVRGLAGYTIAFYATRSPKLAGKVLWYAPKGARRVVGSVIRWAWAEEGNFKLRQHAANTNDAHTWQALDRTRAKSSKARWWLVIPATLALTIAVWVLAASDVVPRLGWWAVIAALLIGLARVGWTGDTPFVDRVSNGPKFTKLTAEMVRKSFTRLGLSQMKELDSMEFVHPGIHRDGPGWLARVNLPEGLEAVKVIEQRGRLSSALRLPVDQVWPAAGPEHAGQVDLWVGYQPASKMGQPKWSLAAPNAVTSVFEPFEFGTDERQRPVKCELFARSWLIGGQPGSGKSYAARSVAAVGMLDPTAEYKIAEFKGTGDFLDLEPICSTYVVGVDDESLKQGAAILVWALGEAEKRGRRILAAKKRGEAPHGKVTPELSRKSGSGLHPVVLLFDEVHELFSAIPEAAANAERLIKRARALNMEIILATQIPDKTSLPPNIVRCVTNRWCLSVAGQQENDMILGTGAYKRGITGTVYRPVQDAGWGCMTGLPTPVSVRSQFPPLDVWDDMVARAIALRHGRAVGATGEQLPAARDLLADLLEVAASNGQHWDKAAPALSERWPQAYPALTQDALSELARALGVESVDVKVAGRNRKGYKSAELRKVIVARDTAEQAPDGPGGGDDRDDEGSTQS
ncbi:ATP-binding protein [Actinoplanes friuliensis]|uniref:Cell division protein ftsk/spoiiie n=1 Tax=Actinoplanes friuliensis DSM 7358 TaxID=1246995 RepID=U5VV76_9ACTN|nr:cell division protein ftsk/spoiiie [Actinoplanes friuliensis]AGZ39600.1 cell division protein ftsk/spoiiie [Actinoplanes friuliensis DSM 7358]